jgi:hypothetical protein
VLVRLRVHPQHLGADGSAELERVAHLRKQDGRLRVPASCAFAAPAGHLDPAAVQSANALWQQAVAQQRAQPRPEVAEAIEYLALAIAEYAFRSGNVSAARSVLECSLQALGAGSGRQTVVAALAVVVCRAGELPAADLMLAGCNRRSADLLEDSAYRHAAAWIETSRSNHAAVIRLLGASPRQIPIHERYASTCAVLRAHAWEKAGQLGTAVEQLVHWRHEAGPVESYRALRVLADSRASLCPQSAPLAEQWARTGVASGPGASVKDAIVPAMGAFFLCGAVLQALVTPETQQGVVGYAIALFCGLVALLFLVQWTGSVSHKRKQRELDEGRVRSLAQITSISQMRKDSLGLFAIGLRVLPEDAPSWAATSMKLLTTESYPRFPVGGLVVVKIHPKDSGILAVIERF